MRLKKNIIFKDLGGEIILCHEEGHSIDFTEVATLNSTAAFLIKQSMDKEFDAQLWAKLLVEKYSIGMDQALQDASVLIDKLISNGFIDN